MIAARLAGGNLFFAFLWWGDFGGGFLGALGAARSTRIFLRDFWWRDSFFVGWWGVFWIVSVGKN